ncbi:MAG TPA: glycosyltransferase family 2 protein [Candidatus Merdivicinus intestinavium]|nr:glycosyltransferase family 2 protein [Candidatus Merdivicinus intestinavium]
MTLYIVVPCYNEEAVLPETSRRLAEKLETLEKAGKISPASRVLFVDDGSKDRTWELISALHRRDPRFGGVKLSRNRGHQNALLAGLMTAKDCADAVISMDADLQDDVDAIDRMVDAFAQGFDIVYGVRSSRRTDTFFKRATAQGFYKFMKLMGVDIVYNHADFRLMSRRALEGLSDYEEVNLFLRGIVPLIGYPSTTVEYERAERFAGESKYPLKKMLAFAFDGITSFSVKPIRWVTAAGFLIFVASILALIYILVVKLLGFAVAGWSATTASIWLLGGLELLGLGVIGEYVGKIYTEVKSRPRYLIEAVELTPGVIQPRESGTEQ